VKEYYEIEHHVVTRRGGGHGGGVRGHFIGVLAIA